MDSSSTKLYFLTILSQLCLLMGPILWIIGLYNWISLALMTIGEIGSCVRTAIFAKKNPDKRIMGIVLIIFLITVLGLLYYIYFAWLTAPIPS